MQNREREIENNFIIQNFKIQKMRTLVTMIIAMTVLLAMLVVVMPDGADAKTIYMGQKKVLPAGTRVNKATVCNDVDQKAQVVLMQIDDDDNEVAILCNTRNTECPEGIMMCSRGQFQCVCKN